jgi:formylglycine-generating enzyme
MRVLPVRALSALVFLLIGSSASAVTMAWTPIGNPGNACDPQPQGCFGAVNYGYSIGTYEVTNAQYAEFLDAKAATDLHGLYNTNMGSGFGGITRSGSSGSYAYSAIPGRADMPVNFVGFYDALRFANWMNNGQGTGSTETGAYTMRDILSTDPITRTAGSTISLTSENEWYKAAYYSPVSSTYFDYPTASNTAPNCDAPTAVPNSANCLGAPTRVGSYPGSASPYGTFDQGGNLWEWNEELLYDQGGTPLRGMRGGSFEFVSFFLAASIRGGNSASCCNEENSALGFRLVMIPEPSTGLLVIAGVSGFALRRRGLSTRVDGAPA